MFRISNLIEFSCFCPIYLTGLAIVFGAGADFFDSWDSFGGSLFSLVG